MPPLSKRPASHPAMVPTAMILAGVHTMPLHARAHQVTGAMQTLGPITLASVAGA